MRLLATLNVTRCLCGGGAFLLLAAPAAFGQETAWRGYYNAGFGAGRARFAHRHHVSRNLRLPLMPFPDLAIGVTRQLTERFAVGFDEHLTFVDHAIRYRYDQHGASAAGIISGASVQLGLNAQLLVPLGLRWELGLLSSASVARTMLNTYGENVVIWRTSNGEDPTLVLRFSQPRKTGFFTGAELRLVRWLGEAGRHGLQLTATYQQGLRTLVRADSREFGYSDAAGQRQQGDFGLRYAGSYGSVQLGYCYAWNQAAASPRRRWSSPRYSQPAPPPDDEDSQEAPATE